MLCKLLRRIFKKKSTHTTARIVSTDEQRLKDQIGNKWIKLKGEDDPALEAVLNAAFHSGKVIVALDSCQGLQIKDENSNK